MKKESFSFLKKLLHTPSPTGFEEKIQAVVKQHCKPYAETIQTDLHGNLILGLNTKAKRKVMLAGHCDQIGFMVRHIDDKGFVYVDKLGGIDTGVLYGAAVTIFGAKGPVTGVFGRTPIHKQSAEERKKLTLDLEKLWVDIGAKNKKDAEKRVAVGDPVTFELGVKELGNDFICGPGLDDKVGLYVAVEAFRLLAKKKLSFALYSVSTVQEEVGLRGARTAAYGIDPEIGIAIDVTHASDNPGSKDSKASPCELGKGPCIYKGPNINPVVFRELVRVAKAKRIPYQVLPSSALLGNDANAIQVSRAGVASASIGIPNRYMHTQAEVCHLGDLENSAKLLAAFVEGLGNKFDARPR